MSLQSAESHGAKRAVDDDVQLRTAHVKPPCMDVTRNKQHSTEHSADFGPWGIEDCDDSSRVINLPDSGDIVENDPNPPPFDGITGGLTEGSEGDSPGGSEREGRGALVDINVGSIGELKRALGRFDEGKLARLSVAVWEVLLDKARARGDIEQLVEDALARSFSPTDHLGIMPWVDDARVLWAPGSLHSTSANRHVCRFVRATHDGESYWVWEHPGQIEDEVRRIHEGTKTHQHSITLALLQPGAEVDVVTSVAVGGVHRVKRVDSFVLGSDGDLTKVTTRRVTDADHTR